MDTLKIAREWAKSHYVSDVFALQELLDETIGKALSGDPFIAESLAMVVESNSEPVGLGENETYPLENEGPIPAPPKKFQVACTWTVYGTFEVEAETLEKAITLVGEGEPPYDGLPKFDGYVDDSFLVDAEMSKELNVPVSVGQAWVPPSTP